MSDKEFTDYEIEKIKINKDLDYTNKQIRIIVKIMLYTTFGMILITTTYVILKSLGVV